MEYLKRLQQEQDWTFHELRGQLWQNIYSRIEKKLESGVQERENITSPEKLKERQKFVRQKFLEHIGGLPEMDRTPPKAQISGFLEEDDFRIEKVVFESRPGVKVSANFYLPNKRNGKIPAVLFVCGHTSEGKAYPEYQNVCRHLVRLGMAVLAMDPIGQGERVECFHKNSGESRFRSVTVEHDHSGCSCWLLGDSLARYFLADAIRGIDYLCSREEVDPSRIGVTGNSGGGTQTSMLMIVEDRIAAAAPGTFITSELAILRSAKAQDAEQIWPELVGLGIDHEDILLMMAPRPVMVLGVSYDFFPMNGTMHTFEHAKRYWELMGCSGWLRFAVDRCEHQYSNFLACRAADFFAEVFGLEVFAKDMPREYLDPSQLLCTPHSYLMQEYPQAVTVQMENIRRVQIAEDKRRSLPPDELRNRAQEWLKLQVYQDRKPTPFYLCCIERAEEYGLKCWKCLWSVEEGRVASGIALRSSRFDGQQLPVAVALWDNGILEAAEHEEWIREKCEKGFIVLVPDLAGTGAVRPNLLSGMELYQQFGTMYVVESKLFQLGDSLCAMRCYDLIRTLELAKEFEDATGVGTELYAWGDSSFYAKIAKFVCAERIPLYVESKLNGFANVIESSEYQSKQLIPITLPGVLQYFDMDDLEIWCN